MYVAGQELNVPRKSRLALRRLRYEDTTRVLWIDAICINQDDLIERSQQVALMDKIYKRGRRNLTWLGKADGSTGQALADIRRIVDEMRVGTDNFIRAKAILFWENSEGSSAVRTFSSTPLSTKVED